MRGSSNFNSSGFSRYRRNYLGDRRRRARRPLPPRPSSASANAAAAALPYPVFFCSSALLGGRRTQNRNRISFLRRRPKNKKKTNQTFKTQERSTPTPSTPSCAKRLTSSGPPSPPLGPPSSASVHLRAFEGKARCKLREVPPLALIRRGRREMILHLCSTCLPQEKWP